MRRHGGLIKTDRDKVTGTSRIDGDSPAFRKEQIEEIIQAAKVVGITVGGGQRR